MQLKYLHANKCALSHFGLQPISSSPWEQSSVPSQRSAIGMHKSSPLQKNSGSGPLQARLELLKEGEGEEEDAEEWLETRPPGATISEGMRALTAVAASESNSSVLIMKMAQPSRNDLACPPRQLPSVLTVVRMILGVESSEAAKRGRRDDEFTRPRFLGRCCLNVLARRKVAHNSGVEQSHGHSCRQTVSRNLENQ